nr:hypothetical protein [Tanacetum cinerariifolium]
RTGKVNIPPARPQPVPTGKPKVFAPVSNGRQNRPFLVPTDRGYSQSVIYGRSPELGPSAIQTTIDAPYTITEDLGHPMPLLAAMLSQAQEGEGAGVAALAVPQHMPAPDQPQDHLSTTPRQQTSDPNAPVFEHGQSSDETDDAPFTNVEDELLGGSFHMSPPRSTRAPPIGCGGKVGQEGQSTGGKTQDHKKEDDCE